MLPLRRLAGVTLAAFTLIAAHAASAAATVIFTFQRLSDTQGILTASGTPDRAQPTVDGANYLGLQFISHALRPAFSPQAGLICPGRRS